VIRGVLFDFGETLVEEVSDAVVPLSRQRLVPFPDALAALDGLRRAGLALAIVSNTTQSGERELRRALALLAMEAYFDAVVTSFDVGFEKPQREIFRCALERIGCEPDAAVMVGDDIERDIAGAAAAGLTTIHLQRRERNAPPGVEPTFVVSSLSEAADVVFAGLA
jgi:5'-nucleotidase